MRALIAGRWYLHVTSGTWAGYWLPESSRARLVAAAVRSPGSVG
jgi:hypothetical protein